MELSQPERWIKRATRSNSCSVPSVTFPAVKRFFQKVMRADHRRLPFSISVDKHASYPDAFTSSQGEKVLPIDCKLRRTKYLTNVVEQDHRFIRRRWRAMQCFRSFHSAERALSGIEALLMMRKGQVKRLSGNDVVGQARAWSRASSRRLPKAGAGEELLASEIIFATQPFLPLTLLEYERTLRSCDTRWNIRRETTRRFFPWLLALSASAARTAAASGR